MSVFEWLTLFLIFCLGMELSSVNSSLKELIDETKRKGKR